MNFLNNTDIVVALGFVIFVGVLLYFNVPGMIAAALDKRAVKIRQDLEEARSLRDEAQTLLASFERKQKEVAAQAEEIVAAAKVEADRAAVLAKEEIRRSVERRLASAAEQIAGAEKAAVRQIKDRAAAIAVAAAGDVIAKTIKAKDADALIDASIAEVGAKLH